MRHLLPLVVLLAAGCADPSEPVAEPTDEPPAAPPPLPGPIDETGTMPPSADPVASGGPACTPPSSTCFRYPFTLARNATATATLSWTLAANDLDLYLMQGDDVLEASNAGMTTMESLRPSLPPGIYEFVVQGSTTAAETFRFQASFEPAP